MAKQVLAIGDTGTQLVTKFNTNADEIYDVIEGDTIKIGTGTVLKTSVKFPVGIGNAVYVNQNGGIVIGDGSSCQLDDTYDPEPANGGDHLAIGHTSHACKWRAVSIGAYSIAGAVSTVALGTGACCIKPHGVTIGRGAYSPRSTLALEDNSVVIGGSGCNDLYIANGWGHQFQELTPVNVEDFAAPNTITKRFHGQDAYDQKTVADSFNIAGGHVAICAGRGTGSGIGGEIIFETAPIAAVGQNTKNLLIAAGKFDSILAAAGDTRFLLLDLTGGGLKRISFGIDDSGGAGYKLLRVLN